jgi:hypothetical protein
MSRADLPSSHPFYGKLINVHSEQTLIQNILSKFLLEPVTEELKRKIYNELTQLKNNGLICSPFKVILRADRTKTHRDYIEILLETKV